MKFFKKIIIKLINHLLFNYKNPKYHRYLYDLSRKYVNFYQGDQNPNFFTNGEARFLDDLIKNNNISVAFDVGANVGDYSNIIHKLNKNTDIYCFEPDNDTYRLLDQNVSGDKFYLNNFALSDKTGKRILYHNLDDSGLNSFYDMDYNNKYKVKAKEVVIDTLDNYCNNHNIHHIDLLKIDVEGHELNVLYGANNMLASGSINFIQFEFGFAAVAARKFFKDYIDFFDKFGYSIYKIKPLKLEKVIHSIELEKCSYANFVAMKNK